MSTLCKSEADELTAYCPREKRTNHGKLPWIQPSDNLAPDSINLLRKDSLPMTRENSHNTSLGQSGGDATENAVNHTESKVVTRPGSVISPANGVSARGDPGTAHGSHASLEETRQSYSREDLNESAFSFKVLSNSPKYRRQSFASVSDSQNPGSTQKIRPEVQRIPGIKVTAAGRPCESEGFDRRSSSSVPSMLQTHHWLPPPPPPPQPPLLEYSGWPPPRDVPPPPPPPPPPDNPHFQQFSPSSGNVSPRAQGPGLTDSRLRAFVHRLEETQIQQNEHRELREQALTECHNLKTTRKRLREHRSKTRYMEAKLISELRQVCLNAKALDYETLFSLYEQVGDAQDVLGALEEDYEEEESRYNSLEWQVEKKERDIVSDLLEDILELNILPQNPDGSLVEVPRKVTTPGGRSPEPLPGVSSGSFEFPEQFKSFHLEDAGSQLGAEDQEIDPTELPNDEEAFSMISKRPDTPYTDHVPELVRAKSKVLEGNSDPDPRRASEPITYKEQMLKPAEQPRRPRSENDFASMEQRWPSVHAHVDQWMRETLDESQFEKFIAKLRTGRQIAKARTGSEDIDKRTWWELFKQFWSQAGSDGDPGHENEKSDAEGVNVSLNLEKGI